MLFCKHFNPRTHRGVRLNNNHMTWITARFQSTHPSWGATPQKRWQMHLNSIFQSTHPSWGATLILLTRRNQMDISIHAPIVGCDGTLIDTSIFLSDFNPRTHRGVRHQATQEVDLAHAISIHAPIVGCDQWIVPSSPSQIYFNPRTHRGVRPAVRRDSCRWSKISIHAPIVGCDLSNADNSTSSSYFNPRTHRGVRHQ